MNVLTREIEVMQNPALGSLLLWRFAKAYADAHPQKAGPLLPLAFLVLPLVWNQGTAGPLEGTRTGSGLRFYVGKFANADEGGREVLLMLHDRALRWREKSAASLRLGYATGLLSLGDDGRVRAESTAPEPAQNRTVANMVDGAEKLGVWFAPLTLEEVGITLHVRF